MDLTLLVVGFILLIKGADYFIDGASNIANYYKIPSIIIGLTLVAFGTSLPEASVSITASINGQHSMALGNIVGSNIFNLLMIVGAAGVVDTLIVDDSILYKEFPLLLFSSILVVFISLDSQISIPEGFLLSALFIVFTIYLIRNSIKSKNKTFHYYEMYIPKNNSSFAKSKENCIFYSILFLLIGMILLTLGGKLVVNTSLSISNKFGISDELMGFTIIAIGTSLPELVTALVATTKGESKIALGSVLGSNLFNILFITGISAIISPLSVSSSILIDGLFMVLITVLTYLFAVRKHDISKFESSALMILYGVYMFNIVSNI